LGCGIREPVTTISETSAFAAAFAAAAPAASAWVVLSPRKAAPQIVEEASRPPDALNFQGQLLLRPPPRESAAPKQVQQVPDRELATPVGEELVSVK
jgi:hypothetical protein